MMRRLMLVSTAFMVMACGSALGRDDQAGPGQQPGNDRSLTDPLQHTKRMLQKFPNAKFDPEAILVRFDPVLAANQRDAIRAAVGGQTLQTWWIVPGLEQLKVVGDVNQAVARLNRTPGVVYAEVDYFVHTNVTPNDPSFTNLWGLNNTGQTVNGAVGTANADINAPEAWDIFTGDPNFVIGDIDTGANMAHPDLAANIWTNPGEIAGNGIDDDGDGYIDDLHGWDFVNNDADPSDDNGHGTHTAGTIGAVGNNGVGITGVAWRCKLVPLKFLNASGSGAISGALSALQYCTAKGIKVSNNSWGGGGFSQAFLDAINASQAVGHVFVAAAGNASSNNDATPSYPASYASGNIIAVVATNSNDGFASFSNYGATSCDIGAPGVSIYSTYGSGYAFLDGTSMATPHVTGVVALVYGRNPTWTWSQVRTQILSTARTVTSLSGRCATGGVVNANAALGGTAPPPPPPPTGPANDLCANATTVAYGTTSFTTVNATTDSPAATCGTMRSDVWYKFTACVSGTITVQTCSLASWDTVVAAYSGSCSALTSLACNDDACSTQSRITFTAAAGQTYLIRVGGYNGATGTGSFTVSGPSCSPSGPANNACASATVVGNGTVTGTTVGSTNDGSASCGSSTTSADVWYSYTATCTGNLTIDTCTAASYDTVISVHSACTGTSANQRGCNDDAATGSACAGTTKSSLTVAVTSGVNYKIRVAGYNGATGTFTLRLSCAAALVGPMCACDWNGDQTVNSQDLFNYIGDFMNGAADFDGSGLTNTADFYAFLQCFFAPPAGCF